MKYSVKVIFGDVTDVAKASELSDAISILQLVSEYLGSKVPGVSLKLGVVHDSGDREYKLNATFAWEGRRFLEISAGKMRSGTVLFYCWPTKEGGPEKYFVECEPNSVRWKVNTFIENAVKPRILQALRNNQDCLGVFINSFSHDENQSKKWETPVADALLEQVENPPAWPPSKARRLGLS